MLQQCLHCNSWEDGAVLYLYLAPCHLDLMLLLTCRLFMSQMITFVAQNSIE